MKNKAQAIVMGVCTVFFLGGFAVFAIAHFQQSSLRSELRNDGIEAVVQSRSFFDNEGRDLNPKTGDRVVVNEDAVLFTFVLPDGTEVTAAQPIAEDRYDDLGAIDGLTALFLSGEPENAELLEDGEFVANVVPYWLIAAFAGFLALGAGIGASLSSRPAGGKPAAEAGLRS